jgi:hypothetical protein
MKGATMTENSDEKYPIICKGEAGYWHAYGNGWAVCAPTKESVKQKYVEMLEFMNALISRPLVNADDIL